MPGRLLPSGERAVLAEVGSLAAVLDLRNRLWVVDRHPQLADAVAGARTLLLVARTPWGLAEVRSAAEQALAALEASDAGARAPTGEVVEVPVRYDGADLAEVARLTGLTTRDVVEAHTRRPWLVGFSGFAPGFAYLVDGDPRLHVPRRSTPRSRVPAGSVGLAGEFSGIYPRASPGGWQVIGHTDARLWDLEAEPPALLRPGMRVRFVDAGTAP